MKILRTTETLKVKQIKFKSFRDVKNVLVTK